MHFILGYIELTNCQILKIVALGSTSSVTIRPLALRQMLYSEDHCQVSTAHKFCFLHCISTSHTKHLCRCITVPYQNVCCISYMYHVRFGSLCIRATAFRICQDSTDKEVVLSFSSLFGVLPACQGGGGGCHQALQGCSMKSDRVCVEVCELHKPSVRRSSVALHLTRATVHCAALYIVLAIAVLISIACPFVSC